MSIVIFTQRESLDDIIGQFIKNSTYIVLLCPVERVPFDYIQIFKNLMHYLDLVGIRCQLIVTAEQILVDDHFCKV